MKFKLIRVLFVLFLFCTEASTEVFQKEENLFCLKGNYDIYYQVGESLVIFQNVKVLNVELIGNRQFIKCGGSALGKMFKDNIGYIDFQSVRAILPHSTSVKVVQNSERE